MLSAHQVDTYFVIDHINELKLFVRVVWFGDNLRHITQALYRQNIDKRFAKQKSFIVVHWTPSEIIDVDIEYETISMPKCEQFASEESKNTMCKYELTPILMYCSKQLKITTAVYSMFSIINFNQTNEKYLLQMYNNLTDSDMGVHFDKNDDDLNQIDSDTSDKESIFDQIACKFIQENAEMNSDIEILSQQIAKVSKQKVFIGGIYPKLEEAENEHNGGYSPIIVFLVNFPN